MRPTRPQLLPVVLISALACALALGAIGQAGAAIGRDSSAATRAHAASSYLTGIGNENPKMFANPLYQQLHTKVVRYVVPYDAVAHSYSLDQAINFIAAAEAAHEQVLVAFYHSEYTPTKLPGVATYQRDVGKFVKLFPHIRQYESWDESNRGNVAKAFSSPSAVGAAKYYQALLRVCKGCTVIGLDVLDANVITPTLRYISEFKHEISRLETVMPRIWGLHNYSDVNRLESWRTRQLVRALGGQVWLTETGGLVQFEPYFPNRHGAGLTRAAKVLKYMFSLAGALPQVKRLYVYDWTRGTSGFTRFDAGLTNAKEQPRAGYVVVCRQLRAAKCGVRIASN
ncbi:MAG TPA: hypothetical protein VK790_12025 [Solirubrobacteraceae bacterium]|jgi:hypothetical protein|nr:hypothetical protein [Solirubrobacteraceae bacterium]